MLASLARIPHRVGFAVPECTPFLTHAVPYMPIRHEVEQNWTLAVELLDLVGPADPTRALSHSAAGTALRYQLTVQEVEAIEEYLSEKGIARDALLVAVHPGAGAAVKQWSAEGYAAVADDLVTRHGARLIITGGRSELDLAWTVSARMFAVPIVAAGDTTLGELAALFKRCRLVIGPDSGPLHVAVAVGTPSVHLYGPVNPQKFGPWGPGGRHRVVISRRDCVPCNRLDYSVQELSEHPCVSEIEAHTVLAAANALLAGKGA
jgi:heptosyltransferase-2/heptosyltransferase-3